MSIVAQTAGWMKTPLGTEVDLGPDHIVVDRDPARPAKGAQQLFLFSAYVYCEGRQSLNRDEGSYTLSHTYDRFLATSHHCRGKNQKRN